MDRLQTRSEILEASDDDILEAVKHASPLVLRGLLYQLTGDESLTALHTAMVPAGFRGETPAIIDPETVALVQAKAAAFLIAHRESGAETASFGPINRLHRSMELAVGASIPNAELEM